MAYRTTSWKNTDIGNIPSDWNVKKVKDYTDIVTGGTPSTQNGRFWGGNIRWMNSGELNKKNIYDVEKRITEEGLINSSTSLIPLNCVLVGLAGQGKTRGTVAINFVPLCTNQSIAAILPNKTFDSKFVYHNLDNRYLELRSLSTGEGGRGGLNKNILLNVNVAMPSLSEQQKIAEVLTDLDDLIAELEKVRDKKQAIKIGAMQELLTGKRRLPGFNKPWKEVELGEVGRFYSGLTGKTKGDFDFGQPFIKYNDVSNFYRIPTKLTAFVNVSEQENQNEVSYGDVFFTASSETAEEAGLSSVLLYQPITNTYLNSFCLGFRINDFNSFIPMFASYYLRSDFVRKQICLLAQGTGIRYNLSRTKLVGLKLHIPTDKSEQEAIANILSDMDDEISAINDKINKYKQIKAGVADELLSGRIRLIKPQE